MKTKDHRILLALAALMGVLGSAQGQLTATVQPGYQFSTGERPTTATLNQLGQPTVTMAGTISGTVGLAAKTVNGVHLADGVVDNTTVEFNTASPRAIRIKAGGVSLEQLNAAVAGSGLTGGGGTALSVQVDGVSLVIADGKLTVTGAVTPVGSVTAFAGAAAPTGWLECNGDAVSRTTYAALYTALGGASSPYGQGNGTTTFNVPDLRGEFVRGWDHGRGVDVELTRTMGSGQTNQVQQHQHALSGVPLTVGHAVAQAGSNANVSDTPASATGNIAAGGGTETRPRNVALMYILKW